MASRLSPNSVEPLWRREGGGSCPYSVWICENSPDNEANFYTINRNTKRQEVNKVNKLNKVNKVREVREVTEKRENHCPSMAFLAMWLADGGPILDVGSLRSRSTDGPALLKFSALNVGLFRFYYSSAVGIALDNR